MLLNYVDRLQLKNERVVMTDSDKKRKILEAVKAKLDDPKVPNDVNGKLIVELKEGGVMDKKIEAKL